MIADLFSGFPVAVDKNGLLDLRVWVVKVELNPRTRSHFFQNVDLNVWVLVLDLWDGPDAKLLQTFTGSLVLVEVGQHDLNRVAEVKRIRLQVLRRLD